VLEEKPVAMTFTDGVKRDSVLLEPTSEVLHRLNVAMNRVARVASSVQIADKVSKNYGEMTGRHPAESKRSLKAVFYHGDPRKGCAFSVDRHTSSYAHDSQMKAKSSNPESSHSA
jgi:hypothetical protein